MIIWIKEPPSSAKLEQFLCCFRDAEFSDHLLNDCDLAFIDLGDGGFLNLVVPRSDGTFKALMSVWHLSVTPYYPYVDIEVQDNQIRGVTNGDPTDPLRCRLASGKSECITIFQHSYDRFLDFMKARLDLQLVPWFVHQGDSTLRFRFVDPGPGVTHKSLTLDQTYHPSEYL